MISETKKSRTSADNMDVPKGDEVNLLDAASQGAITAVFLVANIAASLIAVLAFIAFINGILVKKRGTLLASDIGGYLTILKLTDSIMCKCFKFKSQFLHLQLEITILKKIVSFNFFCLRKLILY